MERMISKLTVAFVALLLCAAVATTANSQAPVPDKGTTEKVKTRKPPEVKPPEVKPVDKLGDKVAAKRADTWFPRISDVRVTPGSRKVILSFKSVLKTKVAVIEIGTTPPVADPHGNLSFPPQSGAFARFVPLENGRYNLDLEELELNTTYYYIINVLDDENKARYQDTGRFTTTPQKVTAKVIFTDLRIFPGFWDLGLKAKYVFIFDVNVDYTTLGQRFIGVWPNLVVYDAGRMQLGTKYEPLELPKGKTSLQGEEIVIENSPDNLLIVVQGLQDANQPARNPNSTQSYTTFAEVVAEWGSQPPGNDPHNNNNAAYYNVAKGNFKLSAFPGDSVSIPFTLPSRPLTPSRGIFEGFLAFEISGRIEITRQ